MSKKCAVVVFVVLAVCLAVLPGCKKRSGFTAENETAQTVRM